ncbi:MAG: N-6 DNA methylase [Spirosomataceae bacterium]
MNSKQRKEALATLLARYIQFKSEGRLDLTSEETIRTWLNELLSIFGWDVQDTSQVLQEKTLTKSEKEKLKEIGSSSTRPDYTFKVGKQKLTFLDAKDISVDLSSDNTAAFQIKSYGWSILAPCAFISNFEQFAIYDTGYVPHREQPASFGRIFLSIDEYLEHFDILESHLLKDGILAGKLTEIYASSEVEGVKKQSPDLAFAKYLSKFRLELANEIVKSNPGKFSTDAPLLSYVVQIIINRILFIRVCEARKLEEEGLLLHFQSKGFWETFKNSSYFDFYDHYDGPLFDRIDEIHQLTLADDIFSEFLAFLYYPSPYRFDVIPTKLLSDVYEIFLSKKLLINGAIVEDALKPEYSKSKGAVSTPQFIVEDIIKRTLSEETILQNGIKSLLNTKSIDIACGSGVFLIGLFEYFEQLIIQYQISYPDIKFNTFFADTGGNLVLTLKGKQALIHHCIYGVDIDPEAVEVAKMSLALKIIDNEDYTYASEQIGLFGKQILNGVGSNIRCGNSLVDSLVLTQYPDLLEDDDQLFLTRPFDWEEEFDEVYKAKGGFDYIVGNPPYVEVKHFNVEMPYMHAFIKDTYQTGNNGKIDLAVPFIERSLKILNPQGYLGFIVQKRFFKTDYGSKIRELISSGSHVSCIIDYATQDIFKGRMTYVATLILSKEAKETFCYHLADNEIEYLPAHIRDLPKAEEDAAAFFTFPSSTITANPWSFDDAELLQIKLDLSSLGTFGQIANVKVGLQALKNEAYHIQVDSIEKGIISGSTHWAFNIKVEEAACRPLMCNVQFYPFRPDTTATYVIFPYDIIDGKKKEIPFSEFRERFPLAGAYLLSQKARLEGSAENGGVETMPVKNPGSFSSDYWHIYTRANNIEHTYPKVMIPMTALDTFATVTFSDGLYCDNANMFFVQLSDITEENLFAIAGIVNTTAFSVLGRSIANPQSNGYFKFNKQFLEPIPFPVERFQKEKELVSKIAAISQTIQLRQDQYQVSPLKRSTLVPVLRKLWAELDELVYELYDLSETQKAFFNNRGRNINRIDFLNNWM